MSNFNNHPHDDRRDDRPDPKRSDPAVYPARTVEQQAKDKAAADVRGTNAARGTDAAAKDQAAVDACAKIAAEDAKRGTSDGDGVS